MENNKPVAEVVQQIAFECSESGATKWQVLRIIKELEEGGNANQQLRRKAAEILSRLNPEAAKNFMSFERLKVYTSAERREPFDRGNIIRSLLAETRISRHVAEKIGSEVEDKIKDLHIEYLNTQLIREMVSVKLLELGHEPIHAQYARIGMPVFEVAKRIGQGSFENREILREYNWLVAIPKKARELHFDSFIHIFEPQDYSTKIYASSKFIEGQKEDICMQARELDSIASKNTTLKALNFALAGAGKVPKREILKESGSFGKVCQLAGGKRIIELSLFTDFEWRDLSAKKRTATSFANALLAGQGQGIAPFCAIDSKYQLKLLAKENLGRQVTITNNSRERVMLYHGAIITGSYSGIAGIAALNLEKIAQASGGKDGQFFERLEEIHEALIQLFAAKRGHIEKRDYYQKWMDAGTCNALCLSGLFKAGSAIGPDNVPKAAERIISVLQKDFRLTAIGDEDGARVFSVQEDRQATQGMLLAMNSRHRREYGFAYTASTLKEAESLLADCPCVELTYGAHMTQ